MEGRVKPGHDEPIGATTSTHPERNGSRKIAFCRIDVDPLSFL